MSRRLIAADLYGIAPPVPTPVTADDTVDTRAVRTMIQHLLQGGVTGVVPLGGTGEYGSLSREQRVRMVATCADAVGERVPTIAGILDPGFHDACASGRAFAEAGADALLVVTPYYTTPHPAWHTRLLPAAMPTSRRSRSSFTRSRIAPVSRSILK